jgi:hypothetical protein
LVEVLGINNFCIKKKIKEQLYQQPEEDTASSGYVKRSNLKILNNAYPEFLD